MRELSVHEISSVAGATDILTDGRDGNLNLGMPVIAGFVGAVSNTIGYTVGSKMVGTFGPVGAVKAMHEGWILPLIADICLKGDNLTPRLSRAAFIGVIRGLGESVSHANGR